ncbi:GNAT family N-acetyltransferase [Isoptericola sp. NPDC019693]|uniref:GNAT family N-acetyltransferase n=1 Tax=Isoptericola sp. NPDC019693 TaxID=3364009 RepID=UPI00379AF57F
MTTPYVSWPREAGNLRLRVPTSRDVDRVLAWRNDPEVTRWLLRTTQDADELRGSWRRALDDAYDQAIVVDVDGVVVATGELEVSDGMGQPRGAAWHRAEGSIGYLVDPAYAGRGIATALAGALLDVAFTDLGLHRVTAGCFAANEASWRVMEKLGMRREQHGVRDSWHDELGWVDGYTYAVLADEWAGPPTVDAAG